jgi:rhamnosyltransferase subunit B
MPLTVILAAIGSSGDVNPVIELGRGLSARGHRVTLATNALFRGQVEANGLAFEELGTGAEAEGLMQDPRLWHPRRGFRAIVDGALMPNIGRLYRLIENRRGPGTVVAATTLCLGARVAQERLGIALATIHLQPTVFRSHVDNGRLGFLSMGPAMPALVKRALFWALDTVYVERSIGPGLNAFRATLGLSPVRGIFASWVHSPELVLGLFPQWFAAVQPDWPRATRLTGFLLHDSGSADPAVSEAEAFLAEGPPPVLVAPGSAAMDRVRFFASSAAACERLGLRAMLVTNHTAQLPRALPSGIRAFPYLPFSRVLPRCAAVIHHGGIGTLAQATRAGIPQLVVPNAHDQPDNAERVVRLGLGLSSGLRRYSSGRATGLLRELLGSAAIRERARQLAPRVDSDAALAAACSHLERLAAGRVATG